MSMRSVSSLAALAVVTASVGMLALQLRRSPAPLPDDHQQVAAAARSAEASYPSPGDHWICTTTAALALREAPDLGAPTVAMLPPGSVFSAQARRADASWLWGEADGATRPGWLPRADLDCPDDLPVYDPQRFGTATSRPQEPTTVPEPTREPPEPGAAFVAYQVPAGTVGNQPHEGPLGLDFDVEAPILITDLGVFDSGQDGLRREIAAIVWDRDTLEPLVRLTFRDRVGQPLEGSRFQPLDPPLRLPAGFRGSMGAEGYGPGEPNGNGIGGPVAWTTDDGGGLLRFVGQSRWDWPFMLGSFPGILDSGPVNRYAAGSFIFRADSAP